MKAAMRHSEPQVNLPPSADVYPPESHSSTGRALPLFSTLASLLAGLLFLLGPTPSAHADRSPPGCGGSGLGISLFTSVPDVHVGDTIYYSVNIFNTAFPACDAGQTNAADAGAIRAFLVTPDGHTNYLALFRTYLQPGQSDFYPNVIAYTVRQQDILSDGTVRAIAADDGAIHQNDTLSHGGGNQGVNTEVNLPCVLLSAQCVGSVGQNGAIAFTGSVTNCGNTMLVGVTVTNFYDSGSFTVLFPTNLDIGQSANFSGSWVPLNPCLPSTAVLTVRASDEFTSTPRLLTNFTTITCQNTLTSGIKVTKLCPDKPVAPGQLLTFSGSVSNTGNVTLTNIVVVNNRPVANTPRLHPRHTGPRRAGHLHRQLPRADQLLGRRHLDRQRQQLVRRGRGRFGQCHLPHRHHAAACGHGALSDQPDRAGRLPHLQWHGAQHRRHPLEQRGRHQ